MSGPVLAAKSESQTVRRFWLITVGEPLPASGRNERLWRTGILSQMLAMRGHEVVWWTSDVNHFTKRYFPDANRPLIVGTGLTIRFLHGTLYRQNISLRRYWNHRQIARAFSRESAGLQPPDAIVVSLPTVELAEAAVDYGNAAKVPVIVDIRDRWPDEVYARFPPLARPLARVLLAGMEQSMRAALRGAYAISAVSREYLEWARQRAGRVPGDRDRVFTFGYPDPATAPARGDSAQELNRIRNEFAGRRIIWFVGTFVNSIDLATVIDAARMVTDLRDVVFVLSGSGERDREWRRRAAELPNVVFTGWLNRDALDGLARQAWLGLGAYKPGALMSLTNKIFEYLAYGVPVLLSLPGEARQIIESAGAGSYYEPGDAAGLARVVREINRAPELRDRMSENARILFDRSYSANRVYGGMADFLESVAATGGIASYN